MPAVPTLKTTRLVLRAFREDDASALQRLLSNPQIAEYTLNIPHPYPDGAALEWIRNHEPGVSEGSRFPWAITLPDGTLIGAIHLGVRDDPPHGVLGYWLGVEYWGNGYMTETVRAVIAFGFDRLGLHRVEATVFPTNPASARVLEKAGMVSEGLRPEPVMKDGVPRELIVFGISREQLGEADAST